MSDNDDQSEGRVEIKGDSGEFVKFGVLVAVLLGALAVIALLRPLVFERIVPNVLGMNVQSAPLPVLEKVPPPTPETTTAAASGGLSSPAPSSVETRAVKQLLPVIQRPDMLPVAKTFHTVQQRETLYRIAIIYGVAVEEIAYANRIVNPRLIKMGTVLVIPLPD